MCRPPKITLFLHFGHGTGSVPATLHAFAERKATNSGKDPALTWLFASANVGASGHAQKSSYPVVRRLAEPAVHGRRIAWGFPHLLVDSSAQETTTARTRAANMAGALAPGSSGCLKNSGTSRIASCSSKFRTRSCVTSNDQAKPRHFRATVRSTCRRTEPTACSYWLRAGPRSAI